MQFNHFSVMLNECIDGLDIKQNGIYIDCTLGGGGHSSEILKNLDNQGRLIALDQDDYAITYCKEKFKDKSNVIFVKDNFKNLDCVLRDLGVDGVDGILMDLGVSSYQIDTSERGFSYMRDGELDMRMDKSQHLTAKKIINEYSDDQLNYIFKTYGEEKYHRKIVKKIMEQREIKSIETTFDLVEIIDKCVPRYEVKGHSSKKVFQALRIEVNDEINILEKSILNAVKNLKVGGRLAIITFHSLEDRIVKNTFNYLALDCICPKQFPICKCDKKKEIKIINRKPILPSSSELSQNSRSLSAKLRIAEKLI